MKARPILFKPDMVRAILEGRKTQTRRVANIPAGWQQLDTYLAVKPGYPALGRITSAHPKRGRFGFFIERRSDDFRETDIVPCPYGAPGDVLWCREAFSGPHCMEATDDLPALPPAKWPPDCPIHYWADGNPFGGDWTRPRPSIHMPRWASRLTLEITDVRVERLNSITVADAAAEGCEWPAGADGDSQVMGGHEFAHLWESINGPGSWDDNPFVWVVEFEPHHMNVDAFLEGKA